MSEMLSGKAYPTVTVDVYKDLSPTKRFDSNSFVFCLLSLDFGLWTFGLWTLDFLLFSLSSFWSPAKVCLTVM